MSDPQEAVLEVIQEIMRSKGIYQWFFDNFSHSFSKELSVVMW